MNDGRKETTDNRYADLTVGELKRRIQQAERSLKRIETKRSSKNLKLMKRVLSRKQYQEYKATSVTQPSSTTNNIQVQKTETYNKNIKRQYMFSQHAWVSKLTHIITDDDLDGITAGAIFLHESPGAKVIFSNARRLIHELSKIRKNYEYRNPIVAVSDIGIDGQDISKLVEEIKRFANRGGKILYVDHHEGSDTLQLASHIYTYRFINLSSSAIGAAAIIASNLASNPNTWRLAVMGAVSDRAISFGAVSDIVRREVTTLQRSLSYPDFPMKLIKMLAEEPNKWLHIDPQIQQIAHEAEASFQKSFQKVLKNAQKENTKYFCVYVINDQLSKEIDGLAGVIAAKVAFATKKISLVLYSSRRHSLPGEPSVFNFSSRSHNAFNADLLKSLDPAIRKCKGKLGGHQQSLGGWIPKFKINEFLEEIKNITIVTIQPNSKSYNSYKN